MVSRVMRKAAWGPVRRSHLWRERVVFESSSSMGSVNDAGVLKRSIGASVVLLRSSSLYLCM